MNEFEIASKLEREKMLEFIPTFINSLKEFKYQFSKADGYDNHDIKMFINNKPAVGEIKIRYKHYFSGYYLETQKLESLQSKYQNKDLYYFCIGKAGVYCYNLSKVDFTTIKKSQERLPKTSAIKSKLILKDVYTLPLKGNFVKHYPIYLV